MYKMEACSWNQGYQAQIDVSCVERVKRRVKHVKERNWVTVDLGSVAKQNFFREW